MGQAALAVFVRWCELLELDDPQGGEVVVARSVASAFRFDVDRVLREVEVRNRFEPSCRLGGVRVVLRVRRLRDRHAVAAAGGLFVRVIGEEQCPVAGVELGLPGRDRRAGQLAFRVVVVRDFRGLPPFEAARGDAEGAGELDRRPAAAFPSSFSSCTAA